MDTIKTLEAINHDRRRFFGTAAMTIAAARFTGIGSANAQPGNTAAKDPPAPGRTASTSFGPLKQIDAGVLNVGYAEAGPAAGPAVILLHGWPYDIHTYVDVAPLLASAGYRVIVPYLRGYGTTRFLSSETPRNGQQAAHCRRHHRADGRAQDRDRRSSRAATGARAPPTSWRRSGRSAARRWSRSAAI